MRTSRRHNSSRRSGGGTQAKETGAEERTDERTVAAVRRTGEAGQDAEGAPEEVPLGCAPEEVPLGFAPHRGGERSEELATAAVGQDTITKHKQKLRP